VQVPRVVLAGHRAADRALPTVAGTPTLRAELCLRHRHVVPLHSRFRSNRGLSPSAVRRRVDTVQLDPAEMMPRKATRMPAAKIAAAKWMSEVAWPLYHHRRRTEAAHCGPRRCNKVGRKNVL
jgi:hypothetical protein